MRLKTTARKPTLGPSHLDEESISRIVNPMTLLAIKHQMKRLKARELRELNAYLIRLRHSTPEWKRATAKKIRAVQAGRYVTAEALEARISRG
jgi:hypothetical protein